MFFRIMFYGIKKWFKNLAGSRAMRNFALAFGTEVPPRPPGGRGREKSFEKNLPENLAVTKTFRNFAKFFGDSETGAPRIGH